MQHHTPMADMREAATIAGAETFEVTAGGNTLVHFRNGWGAARYLLELARKDARRDWVRAFALWLRQKAGGTDEGFARALQAYGQSLPFFHEEGERFQGPAVTAESGGDCDCHARLVYAVAKAGGLPTELAFLHKGENPTHVYVRVFVNGAWQAIETTVPSHFGEDPFTAARRLGVTRDDITPETINMGETDNGDCPDTLGAIPVRPTITKETDQLDDGFFDALVQGEREDGGTAEMRAAILLSESGLEPAIKNSIGCVGLNQFCPGTLERYFTGGAEAYRQLPASQQMVFIRKFWNDHVRAHGASVLQGSGRNLYWVNFLPDSYNGAVDDSWLIAAGPRTGDDSKPSTWDPAHDFYVRPSGQQVHFGSLLKQNPGFVTFEGARRVIRASALTRAIAGNVKANPKRWAEVQARIAFARAGGKAPSGGSIATLAMFVGAAALGAAARYFTG